MPLDRPLWRRLRRWPGLLVGLIFFVLPCIAMAHGLSVFAWVEGERVWVESKFSGGKRPVDARVKVFDMGDQLLLEGRTDNEGRWVFDLPQRTALKIVLEAGMGHRGEWRLSAEEVKGASAHKQTTAAGPSQGVADSNRHMQTVNAVPAVAATEGLEAQVTRAVNDALGPVNTRLARLEEAISKPSFQDIIGGIGYILGLVGIGAYVRARRLRATGTASTGKRP